MKTKIEECEDFYHSNRMLPVYSHQQSRFDTQDIISILLNPELKNERVCKSQPVNVEHNATFVVDLTELESPKDMYADDMGSWKYNGVYRAWATVESDGFTSTHGNRKPCRSEEGTVYHIVKKYFVHKTSADLKKTVAFLSGMLLHV